MRLRMNDPAHPTAHASPTRCQRKKGIMKANASGSQGFQTPLHVDQPCHIDAGASGEPENGSPAPLQSSPVRAAWHGADAGTANWDCGLSALSPTRAERGCLCASGSHIHPDPKSRRLIGGSRHGHAVPNFGRKKILFMLEKWQSAL
ncbi:hypothetical protein CISG_06336 [Coccidioides immitis RMSCC 3703]|uniref:Uncharacterized protein n=1 Tax=Coccidioides immitis RMSCC 3703 TaxID=454286 RepID=A0A0J8QWN8_COCIT|nr:hypothetical protein CISG_06336 [Coccidioides immitis RMSCC 3703]